MITDESRAGPSRRGWPLFLTESTQFAKRRTWHRASTRAALAFFERCSFYLFWTPLEKLNVSPPSLETPCDTRSAVVTLLGTDRLDQHESPGRHERARGQLRQHQNIARSPGAHPCGSGRSARQGDRAVSTGQFR